MASPLTEICAERDRLLGERVSATHAYSDAVGLLRQRTPTLPTLEYARFRQATEDARIRSEQARLAYEKHLAEHGC